MSTQPPTRRTGASPEEEAQVLDTIGQEWGGLGLSASTYAKVVARIAQAWMAPTGIFNSHLIMAARVERNGTAEQKRRYPSRFASGELRGGIGLTGPNAGTDLQAIRTVAHRDGAGEHCDLEAGMAKLFASEATVENSLEATRVFGGYRYSVDFDLERYYRNSPLMCIGEGTSEMQRIITARQLVERHPA